MGIAKRYIFQGHAVAAEAHIRKPEDHICWIQGAMALPGTGGYGKVEVGRQECPIPGRQSKIVFEAASAFVSGDYIDSEDADNDNSKSPIRTVTAAYVTGLEVLGRLRARSLSAHLVLEDQRTGQPRIAFGSKNPITGAEETDPISGLSVDQVSINIEFEPVVRELCTLEELQAYYRTDCGLEWYGGIIAASIVRSMSWAGDAPPNATIEDNVITIADFGKIYVGELLIEARARRLTLLRLQLGSDGRDNDSYGDVRPNGEGWPPTFVT